MVLQRSMLDRRGQSAMDLCALLYIYIYIYNIYIYIYIYIDLPLDVPRLV